MAKTKTQSTSEKTTSPKSISEPAPTVGEYAHTLIGKQYHHMVEQEQKVLADDDPEYLHQMRVRSRRLSTALQVFGGIVKVPKAGREERIRRLTKALGRLRDLDVQIAAVGTDYGQRLKLSQQPIDQALAVLEKQRCQAFAAVEVLLTQPRYRKLKAAYEDWVHKPQYTPLAHLPLRLLIPELLSPLLSALLLHPAWLISGNEISKENETALHDLRKACKGVRYQAEFFTHCYGKAFESWVDQLKELQENLGKVHDSFVLLELLANELPEEADRAELQRMIQADQVSAMANWDTLRHQYLDPDFRQHLHQIILKLSTRSSKS